MLIRKRRGWELPESAATSEAIFRDRRRLLQGLAVGPIFASGFAAGLGRFAPALAADADPSAGLYPVKRNGKYVLDRPLTDEKYSTTYNNFYEFGTDKSEPRNRYTRCSAPPIFITRSLASRRGRW